MWFTSLWSLKSQCLSSAFLLTLSDWAAVQFKSWVKFYNHTIKITRETFYSLNRKQSKVMAWVFFLIYILTTYFCCLGLIFFFFPAKWTHTEWAAYRELATSSRLYLITMLGAHWMEKDLCTSKHSRETGSLQPKGAEIILLVNLCRRFCRFHIGHPSPGVSKRKASETECEQLETYQ